MKRRPSTPRFVALIVALAACILIASPAIGADGTQDPQKGIGAVRVRMIDNSTLNLYEGSHALIVGVSDYDYWSKLPGVKDDVEAVKAALVKHGFKVEVVNNPTQAEFEAALNNFRNQHGLDPGNRLLFYFAGHGHTTKDSDGRLRGFVVPKDAPLPDKSESAFQAKAISMDRVELLAIDIRAKHGLFLFDSCFSGLILQLREPPGEVMRGAPPSIWSRVAEPVRLFITAGKADQRVPDNSIFRRKFIEALSGQADLNHDGYITGTELGEFIKDKVENHPGSAQTPLHGKLRNLDKGDFVFVTQHALTSFDLETRYAPTGWMGDIGKPGGKSPLAVTKEAAQIEGKTVSATRIEYQQSSGSGWAGIYWQYPETNWGDKPGLNLTGAKKISFYAKGERGGEIVKFISGGIDTPGKMFRDSFKRSEGDTVLTNTWKRYEIDLSGEDLSSVIGAFAWVSVGGFDKGRLVTYLANIKIESASGVIGSLPASPQAQPGGINQNQTSDIKLSASRIERGQSVTLTWNAEAAEHVYITGIGKVPPKGIKEVKPDETTTYTIITEGPSGIEMRSVIVEVGSSRSSGEFPEEKEFTYSKTGRARSPSFTDFLHRVHHILQDELKFIVKNYQSTITGNVIFWTNLYEVTGLFHAAEKQIQARHVSYRVEVDRSDGRRSEYSYTIKVLIKYKRKVEKTWRVELETRFYQQATDRLRELIDGPKQS